MKIDPLYQTVKNEENVDYLEKNGAILGEEDTWLGIGYYFWEAFIEEAHWWGRTHCNRNYMICQAYAEFDEKLILDLVNNTQQMRRVKEYAKGLSAKAGKKVTLSFALASLRDKYNIYKIIRAHSIDCGYGDKIARYKFVDNHKSYCNLTPSIQVCFYEKTFIKDYHVIYPIVYVQGYT